MKFKIYDEEVASKIIETLDENKITYKIKEKRNKKKKEKAEKENLESEKNENPLKGIPSEKKVEEIPKPKRGRKKLTKEEKEARKKKRTPEQQQKINERMAKLRAARIAKKKK
jgi:hypothetical protein